MILGITGSFGSGKTTVASIFKKYGFEAINADKLYHGIYNKDKSLRNKIKEEFETLNRNQIKKIVFSNSAKLKKLNNITHPIIINSIKEEIDAIKKYNKEARIIVDVPLLFEAKMQNMFDKIIVVKCDEKIQFERLLKNGKHTRKEIENILNSQMPLNEKLKHADFTIDNNSSISAVEKQIAQIISSLQKP